MAQFSDTVDIKRPPEGVWRALGQPERWFEGYLETRSRSRQYPAPDTLTFARRVRYGLSPAPDGTLLRLEDNIVSKGLGKLAAPIASRDVKNRWATSLERLKAAVKAGD